jgi:hypothetical protein
MHRLALIIGAILPDVVDKSLLFIAQLGNGRYIAHTLFFLFTTFGLILIVNKILFEYKISKRINNSYSIALSFFIGNIFHLLLDLPDLPLFFPFIDYNFTPLGDEITLWLTRIFTNPFYLSTEVCGLLIIIFIIIDNKLYRFRFLWGYLTKNSYLS